MKTNLRLLRHQRGWNQADLAQKLNISIPAYSKIEAGITDVSLSKLRKIAAIYELKLIELIAFLENTELPKPTNNESLLEENYRLKEDVINLQRKVINLYSGK